MKIYLDNTSLHSSGNAFGRTALDRTEVFELIQLALWIIFSDNMVLNCYGPKEIKEKSKDTINNLKKHGLPIDLISILDIKKSQYLNACKKAAEICSNDIEYHIEHIKNMNEIVISSVLPTKSIIKQSELIKLVLNKKASEKIEAILEKPFSYPDYGVMGYMLASSEELRETLINFSEIKNFTPHQLNNLNSFFRYCYIDIISQSFGAKYAPSIGRAKSFRNQNNLLLSRISDIMDKAISKCINQPVIVPALSGALLEKSKSTPEGIIDAALEFRDKATSFRKQLSKVVNTSTTYTGEQFLNEMKFIQQIGESLEYSLGLKKSPSLWSAIDISFVIGIPSVKLSGGKVKEWLDYRWTSRKMAILGEMSSLAALNELNKPGMKLLEKRCIKN